MGINTGLRQAQQLTTLNLMLYASETRPGVYALGDLQLDGVLAIFYVGRADHDVAGRLRDHVGSYNHFSFDYAVTPYDAYTRECTLWHMFTPRDNQIHPARPEYAIAGCPWQGCVWAF